MSDCSEPHPTVQSSHSKPREVKMCAGELAVVGILGLTLILSGAGITYLSVNRIEIPPILASIASSALTALVTLLISPKR